MSAQSGQGIQLGGQAPSPGQIPGEVRSAPAAAVKSLMRLYGEQTELFGRELQRDPVDGIKAAGYQTAAKRALDRLGQILQTQQPAPSGTDLRPSTARPPLDGQVDPLTGGSPGGLSDPSRR